MNESMALDRVIGASGSQIERYYRRLAENSLQGILIFREGRVVYANPEVSRQTGYTRERLLALGHGEAYALIHPDDRERVPAPGEAPEFDSGPNPVRYRRADGSTGWVHLRMRSIETSMGEATQVSLLDVSHSQLAVEALSASESRYRTLAEAAGNLILELDAEGRIVYASGSYRSVLGLEPAALLGARFTDFLHPDDRERTMHSYSQLAQGRMTDVPRRPGGRGWPVRVRDRDGRWRWIEGVATRLRSASGAVRLMTLCWDITDQLEMERRLRRSEAHLAESQRIVGLGSGEWDVDSDSYQWSDELYRILGLEPGEVVPSLEPLVPFVHPDDRAQVAQLWQRLRAGDGSCPPDGVVFRVIRRDGEERVVRSRAGILRHPDGRISRVSWTIQDVTEHRRLEDRLREAERLESLGLLAGGVAHDFNNLLAAISGNAELLREELASDSARGLLDALEDAARRAAGLVRQMLDFAGHRSLDTRPLDLSEVARDGSSLIQAFVPATARVDWDLAADLPAVLGDRTSVQQVLYNLVSNAVGALGGALGWIGIRTGATHCDAAYLTRCDVADGAAPGPHVFLEVSDTGVGMDEPTRKRIFEPFFTSKSDGRGLGLAAVHGLVRQHRGAIRVTSEPGVGSSFRVLLPAMREAPETAADADAPPERAPSTGVPRPPVLVVDDEAPVRSVLERQLAQAGYPVLGAGNASHALELVREDPAIGCVLLDLTIPGLPASEALRQIRALRPRLPVVLMSGYAREDVGQAVREHAPDAFLAKPFRRRELLGTLETVLASV